MTALLEFSLLFHPLGPSSGHLEPGFWIYVSLSLCARDSVFDDLGTWILDADHGRLVILEFGSWIFLEGILGARVILDLGSWIFRFQIPDSGTVLESGIRMWPRILFCSEVQSSCAESLRRSRSPPLPPSRARKHLLADFDVCSRKEQW